MDLVMPGMDGIEATREINQLEVKDDEGAGQRPRVLVLTSFAGDEKVFPALKAGAMGYLLKDSRSVELVDAIRQVYRNESWLHPMIAHKVLREMRHKSEQTDGPEQLTPRETEVLRLVAQGLGNTEIAEKLFISEVTVRSHVSNIMAKLQLANRVQATLFAINQGLVSLSDDQIQEEEST
jgi:NarL family two-component system response regulator LiaR